MSARHPRGLLDTSAVLDLAAVASERLPVEAAISALTLAELAAGPHATDDPIERARRQDNLQRIEATFQPIPFGAEAARAYGRIFAAVAAGGRTPRGARAVDLLIAATAAAEGLSLYTRNTDDVAGLDGLVEVIGLQPAGLAGIRLATRSRPERRVRNSGSRWPAHSQTFTP